MRALPDLDNPEAMAAWGRRSALLSARKDACEALRDAATHCQSADVGDDLIGHAKDAKAAAERLIEVSELWKRL